MTAARSRDASLVLKTVKISGEHERWLKAHPDLNFSGWVRDKLDQEIARQERGPGAAGVSALILAAGADPALRPLSAGLPKALLDVRGKSLLERQVDALEAAGVGRIGVLRGYQAAKITFPGLYYYDNPEYTSRGILHSVATGLPFLVGSTFVIYADTLFRGAVVERLLATAGPLVLGVDPALPSRQRGKRRVVEAVAFGRGAGKGGARPITHVSRSLPRARQGAEFIGLALIRAEALGEFTALVRRLDAQTANAGAHLPTLFEAWIRDGHPLTGAVVESSEWMDVDTFEDYRDAWSRVVS